MELTETETDRGQRWSVNHGSHAECFADTRGRVPFAILGVLLVITSATFVGHTLTKPDVNPNIDASVAISQTEGTTQSAIRTGAQRGIEAAAAKPLTDASDTEWGSVFATRDTETSGAAANSTGTHSTDTFRDYLTARIYLEVADSLEHAGQQVGDVRTTVSVPGIEQPADLRSAIDRVTLEEPDDGVLRVTIENVSIVARSGERVIADRETTMTASIATPIMQLHDRVDRYERALNAGLTERGFRQRFTAWIYALGWARGYAQNYQAPIVQVLANRHIEPAANDAVYRTQQDVFGAADPELQDANRLGWTCMALKDGGAMFDEYMGSNDVSHRNTTVTDGEFVFERSNGSKFSASVPTDGETGAEALCSGAELALGDQVTGELPSAPGTRDVLGKAPGLNATETIGVNQTAYLPFAGMVSPGGEHAIEAVIDRIYTIDGQATSRRRILDPLELTGDASCDDPADSAGTYKTTNELSVEGTSVTAATAPEKYYTARSTVEVSVSKYRQCPVGEDNPLIDTDTLTVEVSTTFGERVASPNAEIDEINSISVGSNKYDRGSSIAGLPADFRNYAGAEDRVTASLLGDELSAEAHAEWVESAVPNRIISAENITTAVDDELNPWRRVTLDHDRFLDAKLAAAIAADLDEMRGDAAKVSHEYSRTDLLRVGEQSPFTRLIEKTERTLTAAYLDRTEPYDSVGQKAIYEARYEYLQALIEELEAVERGHETAIDGIDDKLDASDVSLDRALRFMQNGISAEEPDPVPLNSSHLTGTVTYEVSGAPTYLVAENLTKEDLPAVEANTTVTPFAMRNEELFDSPLDNVADGIVNAVLNVFSLGGSEPTIPIKTAGDMLMAGTLAASVDENPITDSRFEQSLETLEAEVDESLSEFGERVADETVQRLYPTAEATCVVLDRDELGWRGDRCADRSDDALIETIATAHDEIERRTETTLAAYNTTAARAVAIGTGNATALIVENVTEGLDADRYRHASYSARYDTEQWGMFVESALRPAIENASAIDIAVTDTDAVETIEDQVKSKVGDVASEAIEARLNDVAKRAGKRIGDKMDKWAGSWSKTTKRPARIPAGMPLLPVPAHWYATMNIWDIDVVGEYARFEVRANVGSPTRPTATTYVRENQTVDVDIAGESRTLGSVEPINFTSGTLLVVTTPPGVGVGDRDDENPECSPTFPEVGVVDPDEIQCEQTEK